MKLFVFIILLTSFSYAESSVNRDAINKHFGCPSSSFLCKTLNSNLDGDTNRCRIKPEDIKRFELYRSQKKVTASSWNVKGRIHYFGPIRGRYVYDFKRINSKKYVLSAKLNFTNRNEFSVNEIEAYRRKFERASEIWNRNNTFDNNVTFKFDIADVAAPKVFSVKLTKARSRGPYFTEWSLKWSAETIAHEFGHVLGLRDEYEYFDDGKSHNDCQLSSMMCHSKRGIPREHHYFLVFQRLFCEV